MGRGAWGRWELTSAGRVMVISDAPVGADLSGGPQAMWPDKPLAPESALVGRTQLAPDRPPLSLPATARTHWQLPRWPLLQGPLPPLTAPTNSQGFIFGRADTALQFCTAQLKVSEIHAAVYATKGARSLCVLAGENVNKKGLGAQGGVEGGPWERRRGMEIPKHT